MTPPTFRPVPVFVRVWAVLTVVVALLLLFVLGGFVTSFRVGMADPVWPTEPWYLLGQDWKKLEFGFLVEHTHRAAGSVVGVMAILLALGAWACEPGRRLRWLGLVAIVLLIVCFAGFFFTTLQVERARKAGLPVGSVALPLATGAASVVAVGLCGLACSAAVRGRQRGRWVRCLAVLVLIGVMIQGLLGGFRVSLDQLVGPQLAAYHGVFAQVVLALMFAVVEVAAPRRPGDALPPEERSRLTVLALLLPAAVFVQLVWAVWVRHMGSPVAQRLHILTAFVVTGLAVWLCVRAVATPAGRRQLGFLAFHLIAILAVQVFLGVEAYLGKFAAAGPEFYKLPHDRTVTELAAAIRTAHAVIGAALLATTVVFALRVTRWPVD